MRRFQCYFMHMFWCAQLSKNHKYSSACGRCVSVVVVVVVEIFNEIGIFLECSRLLHFKSISVCCSLSIGSQRQNNNIKWLLIRQIVACWQQYDLSFRHWSCVNIDFTPESCLAEQAELISAAPSHVSANKCLAQWESISTTVCLVSNIPAKEIYILTRPKRQQTGSNSRDKKATWKPNDRKRNKQQEKFLYLNVCRVLAC